MATGDVQALETRDGLNAEAGTGRMRRRTASGLAQCGQGADGFTYIGVLVVVAVMGVVLARVGQVWRTVEMREREQELLFVGDQFRRAIARFYEQSPGRGKRYPRSFDELLADPRFPAARRHLRKVFDDPITRSPQWGLVKGPSGEIVGVHSLSHDEPMKKTNFGTADRAFEGRTKYSEWVFYYTPGQNRASPATTP